MNIEVFCCQHKKYPSIDSDCVVNIQVGKSISSNDLNILSDDTGDNISSKNKNYCELTATYWIWKNCNADVVGLTHYRRFFDFSGKKHVRMLGFDNTSALNMNKNAIESLLNDFDIILPKKNSLYFKAYNLHKRGWYASDMDIMLEKVKELFPQAYPYAVKAMQERKGYFYNMLIARKELFDEYCNFIFKVLFEVEKEVQPELHLRNSYQQRIYGFLAEHLMTVFIEYKIGEFNTRIKEVPVTPCFANGTGELLDYYKRMIKFGIQDCLGIRRS